MQLLFARPHNCLRLQVADKSIYDYAASHAAKRFYCACEGCSLSWRFAVGCKLINDKTAYYSVVVMSAWLLRPVQHITSHNLIYKNKLYKIFIRLGTHMLLQAELHMYNHRNEASYELNILFVKGKSALMCNYNLLH